MGVERGGSGISASASHWVARIVSNDDDSSARNLCRSFLHLSFLVCLFLYASDPAPRSLLRRRGEESKPFRWQSPFMLGEAVGQGPRPVELHREREREVEGRGVGGSGGGEEGENKTRGGEGGE